MKFAFGVVKENLVFAFGRLVVAGLDLCTDRIFTKRNPVRLDNCLTVTQVHLPLRFFDEDVVNEGGEHGLKCSFFRYISSIPERISSKERRGAFFYLGFPALCERTPLEINRSQMRPYQWRLYEV